MKDAAEIFKKLHELWPNAHCELEHNNPFQLLLAVVLSAQTTDKAVNKALAPLFARKSDFSPSDLVAMGEKKFLSVIKSIGLAPTKAKNSVALARQLLQLHAGQVPLDRKSLEDLPGVGRKTANVVLNVVAGLPTMAVDTHVARVSVRLGLARRTENRVQIEEDLLKVVPQEWGVQAHNLLIFHGRYHCTARAPKCTACPVAHECRKVGVAIGKA
ncbi:MAG: endonuclease III [Betaproteobacteria bacterium]|nr:endonuclease III [Betaproteobacteria bacterium]